MEKSKLVGMIVPTLDNIFFSNLACQIEGCLRENGYSLFVCGCANSAEQETVIMHSLPDHVAGILSVSSLSELPDDLFPKDFPLVWVDRRPDSARDIPWVANDDKAAMEDATEYLLRKNCQHILLVPGYLDERKQSPRVAGYQSALAKHGLQPDSRYILNRKRDRPTEIETEDMVQDILRAGLPVDGIITSSDRSAFGAMAALRSVGLYVPEDVKLISFDNSPYSAMATPSVTTLDRNPELLAQKTCEVLMGLLRGGQVQEESIVPVSLFERDSTR